MNILFISPTGTFDNGAEISIFNLMKYLSKQGNNVFNIVPQLFQLGGGEYYDECRKNNIYTHFIPALKWWWEEAPGGLAGTEAERAMYYRENIKEISNFIDANKIDIVITSTVNMFQGAVAAACKNIPHFWLIHEFPSGEFNYYLSKIDFIEDNSDNIYAVMGSLTNTLDTLFVKKRVKSFIPYTEIKPSSLKHGTKKRIVSVGRLTPGKNQLELIKAFEKLEHNSSAEDLVFIGGWDDDYKKICDKYIKENRIKNISFLGNKTNPWEELTDQDICVLTSSMESFGLVYVEALLNGVPVIVSDNPGYMSVYEYFKFGTKYSLGDVDELVKKINLVLKSFEKYKSESIKNMMSVEEKYQIQHAYSEILLDLDNLEDFYPKSLRHLNSILTLNEERGKVGLFLRRVNLYLKKIISKIKH